IQKDVKTMPMDGILLRRIIDTMDEETPMRINRITQHSNYEFIFNCFSKGRITIYNSTHRSYGRIQFTDLKAKSNIELTHFLTVLRKHLDGGTIKKITQENYDRIMTLEIDHRDDLGVIRPYKLILELMGRYANLIVVDDTNTIIDASRHLGSFESKDRAIVPGASYDLPPSFNKKDIAALIEEDKYESIRKHFEGVSPILEKEITHRLDTQSPKDIIHELTTSDVMYVYDSDYHILELSHLNQSYKTYPLMDGLDAFYKDLLEKERIKAHTGNILKVLRRELKRTQNKLPKLYQDLENAENSEHFREMGDLLFAYHSEGKSGLKSIDLKDFENNE